MWRIGLREIFGKRVGARSHGVCSFRERYVRQTERYCIECLSSERNRSPPVGGACIMTLGSLLLRGVSTTPSGPEVKVYPLLHMCRRSGECEWKAAPCRNRPSMIAGAGCAELRRVSTFDVRIRLVTVPHCRSLPFQKWCEMV
jgi:hypothetical protein